MSGLFRLTPERPDGARGFTYLGMLFAVALVGLSLAAAGELWSTTSKREKEDELLFIGNEFRQALVSYYASSPGASVFPRTLDELVLDSRFPDRRRHLRRIYVDPMTGSPEWGLVKAGDRIVGVHSLSEGKALRTFSRDTASAFAAPTIVRRQGPVTYRDWVFMALSGGPDVQAEGGAGKDGAPTPPGKGE